MILRSAYYNEIDPYAAQWLRNLIDAGQIAHGDVDERSIEDVVPSDLKGYVQCHFFAGVGVWSLALRNAGWPDDRPIWTGSCPCQPFSAAGKGAGFDDERHLWPSWHWLVEQCAPHTIFGEQVAGKAGEAWFDLVSSDLESGGYAVGASVTAACGFGAPHQRKRLYWVAHDEIAGRHQERPIGRRSGTRDSPQGRPTRPTLSGLGNLGHAGSPRSGRHPGAISGAQTAGDSEGIKVGREPYQPQPPSPDGPGLAHPEGQRRDGRTAPSEPTRRPSAETNGAWAGAEWLRCSDGKARPVEPGTFPLAHGVTNRVGRLRAYGNAIVAPQASAFVAAFLARRPQPRAATLFW